MTAKMSTLTFDHSSTMRLTLGAQPRSLQPVLTHQLPVQPQLFVHLAVQKSLLALVALHLLQESRQAGNSGGGHVGRLVSHLQEVAASCAAAASDVAGVWRRAAGVQVEGGDRGRRAVTGGEALSEDGRLQVAQEQRLVFQMIQSGVCHGENAVTFT